MSICFYAKSGKCFSALLGIYSFRVVSILPFVLYEFPVIFITCEWWSNRSKIAFAIVESPNTSPHCKRQMTAA
jgi:hypothetical protein